MNLYLVVPNSTPVTWDFLTRVGYIYTISLFIYHLLTYYSSSRKHPHLNKVINLLLLYLNWKQKKSIIAFQVLRRKDPRLRLLIDDVIDFGELGHVSPYTQGLFGRGVVISRPCLVYEVLQAITNIRSFEQIINKKYERIMCWCLLKPVTILLTLFYNLIQWEI